MQICLLSTALPSLHIFQTISPQHTRPEQSSQALSCLVQLDSNMPQACQSCPMNASSCQTPTPRPAAVHGGLCTTLGSS